MARSDRLFKKSFNGCLDRLALGQTPSSISGLASSLEISRNTARRVLQTLQAEGILEEKPDQWTIKRAPSRSDYFPEEEVVSTEDFLQTAFMEWIQREDIRPGKHISEAAMARELGVSNSSVRELFIKLSRFGFIRKQPQKSWVLEGFTKSYASELHEVRLLFEMRSIEKLVLLPEEDAFWPSLYKMLVEHREFLKEYEDHFLDFPSLDARFHRLLNNSSRNRFIESFQDVITLIFHYHYRWNKVDEKERNCIAAEEHVRIIEALLLRDAEAALCALRTHLGTAEKTFLRSIEWSPA